HARNALSLGDLCSVHPELHVPKRGSCTRVPAGSGKTRPRVGIGIVAWENFARLIVVAELELCVRGSLLRRQAKPADCFLLVLLDAKANLIVRAKKTLCFSDPLLRRLLHPFGSLHWVSFDNRALDIEKTHGHFGRRRSLFSCLPKPAI